MDELKTIKNDIEPDLPDLKTARKELAEKVALLNQRMAQIQTAPQRDVQRLKEKYSLSPKGLAHLGQTLLGKHSGVKLKEAAGWYEMLKPYLEGMEAGKGSTGEEAGPKGGKGQDIHFQEHEPLPEFLVRLAKISLLLNIGELRGTIENITPDPATLGSPLIFSFAGEQLKDLQGVTIEGILDHRDSAHPADTM